MVQEQVGFESDIVDGYDKGNFEVRSEFQVQYLMPMKYMLQGVTSTCSVRAVADIVLDIKTSCSTATARLEPRTVVPAERRRHWAAK